MKIMMKSNAPIYNYHYFSLHRSIHNIMPTSSHNVPNGIPPLDIDAAAQTVDSNSTLSTMSSRSKNPTKQPSATLLLTNAIHTHNETTNNNRHLLNLPSSLSSPNLLNTFHPNATSSSSSSDSGVSVYRIQQCSMSVLLFMLISN